MLHTLNVLLRAVGLYAEVLSPIPPKCSSDAGPYPSPPAPSVVLRAVGLYAEVSPFHPSQEHMPEALPS